MTFTLQKRLSRLSNEELFMLIDNLIAIQRDLCITESDAGFIRERTYDKLNEVKEECFSIMDERFE